MALDSLIVQLQIPQYYTYKGYKISGAEANNDAQSLGSGEPEILVTAQTELWVKADETLMSIKAFSELTGIEQGSLRYWDDIGLFQPAWRNEENGYRYYSPQQITSANLIKTLHGLDIPLKSLMSIRGDSALETILQLVMRQEKILDAEFSRICEALATINALRKCIQAGNRLSSLDSISHQESNEASVALEDDNSPPQDNDYLQIFLRHCQHAKKPASGDK